MISLTNLIYEPEQLEHLCCFDQEAKDCKESLSWKNTFRIFFAVLHVLLIACWFHLYGWGMFEQYLTNWGICLILVSLCVSTYIPYCEDYKKRPGLMAFNHIILSVAIVLELIVTIVYWTLVHKDVMRRNAGNPLALYYQYAAHTIPTLSCLYNFWATDFLFYRRYSRVLVCLTTIYLSVNCLTTKMTGNISYWFLRFDDLLSLYICLFFVASSIFIPYGLANLSECIKGRKLQPVNSRI